MKTRLLNYILPVILFVGLIGLGERAFAQEVLYTATNTYYNNPFETSTPTASIGNKFTYKNTTPANYTVIATNAQTALNGSYSLSTVNRATSLNNGLYAQLLPSSANFATNVTYEWSMLYKYSTGSSSSDIVDYNSSAVGKCGWRYWVAASSTTASDFLGGNGIYISQSGTSLSCTLKASDFYTPGVGSVTIAPNTLYSIKVRVINNSIIVFFVDEVTSSKKEATTSRGSLNAGLSMNSYSYTGLDVNEARSATYHCQWDDFKLYTPTISVSPLNSTTVNNIANTQLEQGQKGAIIYGFSVTTRGVFNIKSLSVATNTGNSQEIYSAVKLYNSSDNFFTTTGDTQIGTYSIPTGATLSLTTTIDQGGTDELGTTYYYFYAIDLLTNSLYSGKTIIFNSQSISYDNYNGSTTTTTLANPAGNSNSFTINQAYVWTGNTNTTYSTATNWKRSVMYQSDVVAGSAPTSTSYAYIPNAASNNPVSSGNVTLGGLVVESGKSLTVDNGDLSITNTLAADGTVAFTGNTNNTFTLGSTSTNYLGKLSVIKDTKTRTVTLTSTNPVLSLTGSINLQKATLVTNDKLLLKASSTTSPNVSRLDQTTSGTIDAAITGSVSVETYITGGAVKYRGYRLLSSPTNVSSSTSGTGFIDIGNLSSTSNINGTGAYTGGPSSSFTYNQTTPTIYLYDERVTPTTTGFNSGKHKGITAINSTGTSSSSVDIAGGTTFTTTVSGKQIPVGNGYIFYNIGSSAQTTNRPAGSIPNSYIITNKGYLNQGQITLNLWYTPTGGSNTLSYTNSLTYPGYNMVGNPYPATIDLSKLITDNSTSINDYIYMLNSDNSNGQDYIIYKKTGGGSSPYASQYILPGQGFIVKGKATSSTLIFNESIKDLVNTPTYRLMSTAPIQDEPLTGFYMKIEKDDDVKDYCGVYFSKNWSDTFDSDEDALDLDGAAPLVYMSSYTSDSRRTAINDLSDYKKGKTIKLYVNATTDGVYKLKIEQIKNINPLYDIWLMDNLKKDSIDFRANDSYNFNVERNNATTFGAERFKLVIRRKVLPPYKFLSLSGTPAGTAINLTWKTQNEYDFTGFTVEKLNATTNQYDPLTYLQSSGAGAYTFKDAAPAIGNNTYRIKQDDIDSKISYSGDVTINTIKPELQQKKFIVYPNPAATTTLNITFTSPLTSNLNVMVANSNGTVMTRQVFSQQQGTVDISKLKTGVYYVKVVSVQTGEEVGSEGFVKL